MPAADTPAGKPGADRPIPADFLTASISYYRRYAERVATQLGPSARAIQAALIAEDRSAARSAWIVAYQRYLSLGAVYGEFGRLDEAIDGLPGGLAKGVRDPRFAGFHRLELGLWTGQSLARLQPVAAGLVANMRRLTRVLPTVPLPAADFVTRAHEILEDAERDFLSGASVPWSGQGVLAAQASLDATEVVFNSLGSLIGQPLYADIAGRLRELRHVFDSIRRGHGGTLPSLSELLPHERERLDGAVAGALQELQAIPVYLNTNVVHPIPQLR